MGEVWFVQRGDERHPEISGSTFSAQGREGQQFCGWIPAGVPGSSDPGALGKRPEGCLLLVLTGGSHG